MQEFMKPHTPVSEDKNLSSAKSTRTIENCSLNVTPTKNVENDNIVLLSQSCNEKLFKGKISLIFLSVFDLIYIITVRDF